MEQRQLTVSKRSAAGSAAARRLRREGLVPAILYGRGVAPMALAISAKNLRELLHGGGSVVMSLNIEDGADDAPTVMVREIQRDPLTGAVLNVDFQRISLTEKITAQVAVVLVGEAPGLKQGGIIDHVLREIEVSALPTELPSQLELDISNLGIGQSLHVSDLAAPAGVTITDDPTDVIVSMTVPRVVEEEVVPVAEAAEVAEGEVPAAAEAEAAAPAEGGAEESKGS